MALISGSAIRAETRPEDEIHTWYSTAGTSLRVRLVGVGMDRALKENVATLEKESDRSPIKVPFSKLKPESQKLAKDLIASAAALRVANERALAEAEEAELEREAQAELAAMRKLEEERAAKTLLPFVGKWVHKDDITVALTIERRISLVVEGDEILKDKPFRITRQGVDSIEVEFTMNEFGVAILELEKFTTFIDVDISLFLNTSDGRRRVGSLRSGLYVPKS